MPNNPLRAQVIAEARSWIGTPFHHQACARGVGVDCGQLIIGVGQALGICEPMPIRNYGRLPNPNHMGRYISDRLIRIERHPRVADILWVSLRAGLPMHLLIVSDDVRNTVIHAYDPAGRVVETITPFSPESIHSAWAYRGLE